MNLFQSKQELLDLFNTYKTHNNRLNAIKLYHSIISCSLKEAKETVDLYFADENFADKILNVVEQQKKFNSFYKFLFLNETKITDNNQEHINYLKAVMQFHSTFNHPVGNLKDYVVPEDVRKLRLNLLLEELYELAHAFGLKFWFEERMLNYVDNTTEEVPTPYNPVEVLDAHVDLMYVLCGSIISTGQHKIFEKAFLEVHDNNMSKVVNGFDNALKQVELLTEKYGPCKIEPVLGSDSLYVIKRLSDNKLVKPTTYKPVNLSKFYDEN